MSDASLNWETFEQFCLWQLISAHSIGVESILPVLPKLEFQGKYSVKCCVFTTKVIPLTFLTAHSEALTNVLLLLKRIEPTQELLKPVLNRDAKQDDLFVVSVLKFWLRNHEKKLSELISTYLTKSTSSPVKRGKR